jgi:cytochrome P450
MVPGPRDHCFGYRLARRFRREPLTFLPELARRYGDLVGFRMGPFRTFFAFHPELVYEVLAGKAKCFRRWEWQMAVIRQWDGNGLLVSDGDVWLRQRRLLQRALQPRRFGVQGAAIVALTQRLLERWEATPDAPVELVPAMNGLTQEIIARFLFGADVASEVPLLGAAQAILTKTAMREMASPWRLPDWLPLPAQRRKRWAIRFLDDFIRKRIRDRRSAGADRGDVLSMVLAVDPEGDGAGMSDEQARDEAMVLFLSGTDTTAAALAWIGYLLARHAVVQERVAAEVGTILQHRTPTADDVPRLTYTEAVVKEAMRLYPPAWIWFAREATMDIELGGYTIPRGGLVYVTPWVTQRDPRWFADPEKFDPERFAAERFQQIAPFAYFPFGGGPRGCVGAAFAMTLLVLVTATVVQRFRLAPAPGQTVGGLAAEYSLRPRGDVRFLVERRDRSG